MLLVVLLSSCGFNTDQPPQPAGSGKGVNVQFPPEILMAFQVKNAPEITAFIKALFDYAQSYLKDIPQGGRYSYLDVETIVQQVANFQSAQVILFEVDDLVKNLVPPYGGTPTRVNQFIQDACAVAKIGFVKVPEEIKKMIPNTVGEIVGGDVYIKAPGCSKRNIQTREDVEKLLGKLPSVQEGEIQYYLQGEHVRKIITPFLNLFELGVNTIAKSNAKSNPQYAEMVTGILSKWKEMNAVQLYQSFQSCFYSVHFGKDTITEIYNVQIPDERLGKLFIELVEGEKKSNQLFLSSHTEVNITSSYANNVGNVSVQYKNPDFFLLLGPVLKIYTSNLVPAFAIFSTIYFVSYQGYVQDSRNAVRQSDTAEIVNIITQFVATQGRTPQCIDPTKRVCFFKEGTDKKTNDGLDPDDWENLNIRLAPTDPKKNSNGTVHYYVYGYNDTDFQVAATLEDSSGNLSALVRGSDEDTPIIEGKTYAFSSPIGSLPDCTSTEGYVVNKSGCVPYLFSTSSPTGSTSSKTKVKR